MPHARPTPARPPAARRPPARHIVVGTLLVAVALSLAACGLSAVTGPRSWKVSVQKTDGSTFDVAVRDTSGRIANAEFDPAGVADPGAIANPAGRLDTLLIPWAGGSCDELVTFDFAANGQGLTGTQTTTTTGQVCDMMATTHLLRLTLSVPTPAATVTMGGATAPQPAGS